MYHSYQPPKCVPPLKPTDFCSSGQVCLLYVCVPRLFLNICNSTLTQVKRFTNQLNFESPSIVHRANWSARGSNSLSGCCLILRSHDETCPTTSDSSIAMIDLETRQNGSKNDSRRCCRSKYSIDNQKNLSQWLIVAPLTITNFPAQQWHFPLPRQSPKSIACLQCSLSGFFLLLDSERQKWARINWTKRT